MGNPPAFQMYASDFLVDTNDWTVDEVGIYLRLLLSEWVNGGLPNDENRLSRIAGCNYQKFKKKWLRVSTKFELNGSDLLINKRLELERIKQNKYRELQSEKGKMGGRPLKSRSFSTVLTEQKPKESSSSSSSSSSLNINSKEGEKTPFKISSKEEIEEASEPMILDRIEHICNQLYKEKIFPEVNAFKNKMLKAKKNPRSILHSLSRAYIKREFKEGPWAYCKKIIEIESAKYNARDYGKTS